MFPAKAVQPTFGVSRTKNYLLLNKRGRMVSKIITNRLLLIPFTTELIDAAIANDKIEMQNLGLLPTNEWPESDLIEALPFFRDLINANGINGFNSWLISEPTGREIIGSAGFIGNPDDNGNVEIGFGIVPSKRRNGYCSEAVSELIHWAFENDSVKAIIAHCNFDNEISEKVLIKCGFVKVGSVDKVNAYECARFESK